MTNSCYYLPQNNEIELFTYAAELQLPVLIKGPTGCGKTRFIEHMGEKLNQPVYTVACHDDLTAADLVGRHLINTEGTYWQDGPLTKAVREGGICYLDEVVEARKDTTVVLHPLADYRRVLPLDRAGEIIHAHKNFMLVVSYNPGYQNLLKGMKPSTRQRFVSLQFSYPAEQQETDIIVAETGIDNETARQLVTLGKEIRRLKDHDLQEMVSTRLLVYAALLIEKGFPKRDACIHCLAESLTDDAETFQSLSQLINLHFLSDKEQAA